MKKLNLFQQFNFGAWAKDKQFMIQSIKWNDKKGCERFRKGMYSTEV